MAKAGEIYFNPSYEYPAGNIEDKLLIVLKTTSLPTDPVILIPTTTNKKNNPYRDGCNKNKYIFYLKANQDFFVNNTIIQIYILNGAKFSSQNQFDLLVMNKTIEQKGFLKSNTFQQLLDCIKSLKDDIDQDTYALLF
ncbi:MAG TPA: hypothetical protein VMM58_01430 [Bacteroidota bacterium]|nr:hypothetical protein [Bacteroidota bacterium]